MVSVSGAVALIIVLAALVFAALWLIRPPQPFSPSGVGVSFNFATRSWVIAWSPPSNGGNTGTFMYQVTVTPISYSATPFVLNAITGTTVGFPTSTPGVYSIAVVAYNNLIRSEPGTATVTILGPPVVSAFDFVPPGQAPTFNSTVVLSGNVALRGSVSSVTGASVTVSTPQGQPVYVLPGTGYVGMLGSSFNVSVPVPSVIQYLISNLYFTVNPQVGVVNATSQPSGPLSLWIPNSDGTVSSVTNPALRWTWINDPINGAFTVLGVTANPSQYGVVSFGSNGIVTMNAPVYGSMYLSYDPQATTTEIVASGNTPVAVASKSASFSSAVLAGMRVSGTATVSSPYGNVVANTPTYTVSVIPPSAPTNVRAVYS